MGSQVQYKTSTKSGSPADAPHWAVERARKIVQPGENILAIYTISTDNLTNAAIQPFALFMVCPCLWPHALFCSPCLLGAYFGNKAILESAVYVLTDKRLYRSIDVQNSPGSCACHPGKDSGDVMLKDIQGVGIDLPGVVIANQCLPVKQVIVALPLGHPLAHIGGTKRVPPNKLAIYIDDPEQAAQIIRGAMDAANSSAAQPVVVAGAQVIAPVAPMGMEMEREDPMTQLKKLKELLDMEALTQAEFEAAKGPLLDAITAARV